jgi:hypothetical protein
VLRAKRAFSAYPETARRFFCGHIPHNSKTYVLLLQRHEFICHVAAIRPRFATLALLLVAESREDERETVKSGGKPWSDDQAFPFLSQMSVLGQRLPMESTPT